MRVTQLEKDFVRLVARFSNDLVRLVRNAPLEEVHALFGYVGLKPSVSWQERYNLTPSEASILAAAAEGMTREQIALAHGVAIQTLKSHTNHMLRKTGDRSLLAAAARLTRDGERV